MTMSLMNIIIVFNFCALLAQTEFPLKVKPPTTTEEAKMEKPDVSNPNPFDGRAKWIWTADRTTQPKIHADNHRVAFFRRKFFVPEDGCRLTVHISADSRYKLWCNGKFVGRGPAKGDITHHFYDTYHLDEFLKTDDNVLAAQVVCFAPSWPDYNAGGPPCSIMTATNGFVLDGVLQNSQNEVLAELYSDSKWLVAADSAYEFNARPECTPIVGLFEDFNSKNFPWSWQQIDFDDSHWSTATELTKAVRPDNVGDSFMPHRLIPRIIPFLEEKEERFSNVIRCDGVRLEQSENLVRDDVHLNIPPHSTIKILYDVGFETTAFPELKVSGGADAEVRLKYAEVLFRDKKKLRIPDNLPFEVVGHWDKILPGGGEENYEPFWWRTFRFVELTVKTSTMPLTIRRFTFRFTGYPFKQKAQFVSSEADFSKIWEVSWRTLRLCAHETFEDCPYWEQLQYAGDTQISALLSYYMAGDFKLARQALRHFDWSRDWEGITKSRYPSRVPQIIPFWSLHWILMNYDYCYFTGDLQEIRDRFAGLISVLDWFDHLRGKDGLIANVPYWCVADWSPDWYDKKWGWGIPPGTKDGASAMINFMYISSLKKVSELATMLGKETIAAELGQRAREMTDEVNQTFWSEKENLYTDRPGGAEKSQLTNAWAILSGAANDSRAKVICQRLAIDASLCRAAFFGKFFIFRALAKAGEYDRAFPLFQPWKEMLKMGCTTWPEDPSLGRSECHVWSSAPAYDFLAEILGVKPLEPGFTKILIQPHLGNLSWARGQVPTPQGDVIVNWQIEQGQFKIDGAAPAGIPVLVQLPSGKQKQLPNGGSFSFSEPQKIDGKSAIF